MNTVQQRCERSKKATGSWGNTAKWKCGKPAVAVDDHGRNLCGACFKKWQEKVNKSKTPQQ